MAPDLGGFDLPTKVAILGERVGGFQKAADSIDGKLDTLITAFGQFKTETTMGLHDLGTTLESMQGRAQDRAGDWDRRIKAVEDRVDELEEEPSPDAPSGGKAKHAVVATGGGAFAIFLDRVFAWFTGTPGPHS